MVTAEQLVTLTAVETTLDRLEYFLDLGDRDTADVMGGVVMVLLRTPAEAALRDDLRWRRQLKRWASLRGRVWPPPATLADFVVDRARQYLVDARRLAGDRK